MVSDVLAKNIDLFLNFNTFTGVVGKVQKKKLSSQGGKEGGSRKKYGQRAHGGPAARHRSCLHK